MQTKAAATKPNYDEARPRKRWREKERWKLPWLMHPLVQRRFICCCLVSLHVCTPRSLVEEEDNKRGRAILDLCCAMGTHGAGGICMHACAPPSFLAKHTMIQHLIFQKKKWYNTDITVPFLVDQSHTCYTDWPMFSQEEILFSLNLCSIH